VAEHGETWRVFCAIEIPADVRHQIERHGVGLREQLPDVRAAWSREDNIHLTLKFLGDVPLTHVELLSRAAHRAASASQPFVVSVAGAGAFPPKGPPRVLWIGIEDVTHNLRGLYDSLEKECADEGFEREPRDFHPHLTVARIRSPHGARPLADIHQASDFPPMQFEVKDLCVIRSELSPEGSRYTVLARHELGNKPAAD